MSRHRNIRTRTFSEEFDDYDDLYGKSFEENFSVSPGTADQYLYDRNFNRRDSESSNINETTEIEKDINKTKINDQIIEVLKIRNSEDEATQDILQPNLPEKASFAEDFNRDKISKLYKALTTKYDFNDSVDFDYYNIRNFIKDFIIKSSKYYRTTNSNGFRDSSKLKSLSDNNKKTNRDIDLDNEKKTTKKVTSKLTIESERIAPPSPGKIVKNIKQKSTEEIKKIYEKKRLENGKLQLNLVIAGHVDAGKSTIMGHLLSLLGNVSKKNMHKNETEAKKAGKASFLYAWILDETEEERSRGITIDIGQHHFETNKRIINILDAPGHRDFIPNMITGATKADVAILVVDATNGEFESGFESGGQTQEHILLLRSFGITQVAIAINKMDNVNFNQERYNNIVEKIRKFLKQVGFKDNLIEYIPCSGMTGDNLVELSKNLQFQWYKGPTLIQIIDNFSANPRAIDKPFRMSISDFFKGQTSGLYLSGKIDYGYIEVNQKLLIVPNNEYCIVKNIIIDEENQQEAFAGDVISLNIPTTDGLEISVGNVLCDISSPCIMVTKFEAKIVTFNTIETPIINGTSVIIYSICLNEVATISKLCSQLDKNKNEIIKRNPRLIGRNQSAIVQFTTTRPIYIETFENCKEYGRFVFRFEHITLGTGIVTKILS